MMMSTRCFRGDRPTLTGLRLRRIVSFLRRHRLYDTAHALERQTGAFFDAAHFRRLLRDLRWADASSYVFGFIAVGDCSREADTLVVRILILRVMADLAGGRTHDIDALFQRLYASLQSHPDGHHPRRILLSMLSDRARASRLYHRIRPMAVEVILNMAAKCPELKAKAQLPRCTSDPAYILSLGPRLRGCNGSRNNKAGRLPAHVLARSFMPKRPLVSHEIKHSGSRRRRQPGGMKPQSSPVVLLHLRRLDHFLKRQGLHSTAHTLERESMVYFDAAHLQKLVKGGRWEAAGTYLSGFSPLWEGEGTTQKYTSFLHNMEHHAMLAFLACRGEEGGRAASSLFWSNDDAFRKKFPEIAERNDLYRSMASAQTRASVNWEDIKLKTSEELQELLHLHPDVKCSLRMRELQCTPTASEITPLGLRGSWRHQRKRVERKPARELARFLLQKKKRLPSSQQTNQPGDSGVLCAPILEAMLPTSERPTKVISISPNINTGTKHSRPYDAHFPENFEQAFDSQKGAKRLRTTGEFAEEAKADVLVHCSLEMRKPFLLPSEPRDQSA